MSERGKAREKEFWGEERNLEKGKCGKDGFGVYMEGKGLVKEVLAEGVIDSGAIGSEI
jgi:hypothetical protein